VATLSCLEDFHFHLILHLKIHLAGQKFRKEEDVKNEVTTRVRAQAAECCEKKKTRTQAKQMPAQSLVRRKIAKGRCKEFYSLDVVNKL